MAMKAVIDLISFYQFDDSILSQLVLPQEVDRDTLIDNLLMETAELELLYSDFNFLKGAIGRWSAKQLKVWTELLKTENYEYEPLWNKDYHVSSSENRNLRGTEDISKRTDDDNTYTGSNSGTATVTNSVYGFNGSTEAPESKSASSTGSQASSTDSRDISEVVDRDTTDTGTVQHDSWERGNIGVMSTQDLIKQQREVVQFNIYDYIISDFKNRFCLLLY